MKKCFCNFFHGTEGVIAPLFGLAFVVLIGLTSLAVDMGHLYTVRNQLTEYGRCRSPGCRSPS